MTCSAGWRSIRGGNQGALHPAAEAGTQGAWDAGWSEGVTRCSGPGLGAAPWLCQTQFCSGWGPEGRVSPSIWDRRPKEGWRVGEPSGFAWKWGSEEAAHLVCTQGASWVFYVSSPQVSIDLDETGNREAEASGCLSSQEPRVFICCDKIDAQRVPPV